MGLWTYVVNPMIKNPHITSEGSSIIARLAPTLVASSLWCCCASSSC
ncbi:hypothetical protein [Methylogaea oryzae]|nr:hypothetical protein [Methylogaea oryzae]